MPTLLLFVLAFSFWLHRVISKSNRKNLKEQEVFWEKELEANSSRKKDISGLDYIKIPLEQLPFDETTDETLTAIQNKIKELSQKPILNLTGFTNTEIKLEYGTANITFLSECDYNYTLLVRNLYQWGSYLYNQDKIREAILVLEYGIRCKTDISKNYLLLASLYRDNGEQDKINDLILTAESLKSLSKESILAALLKY